MKVALLASLVLLSLPIFAGEVILCKSKNGDKTVTLESLGPAVETNQDDWEYEEPFRLTLKDEKTSTIIYTSTGIAYSADVNFDFVAAEKYQGEEVSFYLYWDELDQSGMRFGDKRLRLDCEAI